MMRRILSKKLRENRGSVTVEATLSLPVAIIAILMLTLILKTLFIYENMDQAILNAADQMAVNEVYATLSHSNGFAEQTTRPLLLRVLIEGTIEDQGLDIEKDLRIKNGIYGIKVDETFDSASGAGLYKITYHVNMIGGFSPVEMTHTKRIKSIWQLKSSLTSQTPSNSNDTKEIIEKMYDFSKKAQTAAKTTSIPSMIEASESAEELLELLEEYDTEMASSDIEEMYTEAVEEAKPDQGIFTDLAQAKEAISTAYEEMRDEHFMRNDFNVLPSDDLNYYLDKTNKWTELPEDKSIYHNIGREEQDVKKFIGPDGELEAVFADGVLLIIGEESPNAEFDNVEVDPINAGSYNWNGPTSTSESINHVLNDVISYYNYGNCEEDTTSPWDRYFRVITYKFQ